MKLLHLLLLVVCLAAFPDSFDDEDDDIEETPHGEFIQFALCRLFFSQLCKLEHPPFPSTL